MVGDVVVPEIDSGFLGKPFLGKDEKGRSGCVLFIPSPTKTLRIKLEM